MRGCGDVTSHLGTAPGEWLRAQLSPALDTVLIPSGPQSKARSLMVSCVSKLRIPGILEVAGTYWMFYRPEAAADSKTSQMPPAATLPAFSIPVSPQLYLLQGFFFFFTKCLLITQGIYFLKCRFVPHHVCSLSL